LGTAPWGAKHRGHRSAIRESQDQPIAAGVDLLPAKAHFHGSAAGQRRHRRCRRRLPAGWGARGGRFGPPRGFGLQFIYC